MNDIIAKIEEEIPDAEIDYQISGSHIMLKVNADIFAGMSRVQSQRYVKNILAPFFESGQLHALSLQVGVKDER